MKSITPTTILKDLFDVYTTDEHHPIYIPKAQQSVLKRCCFLDEKEHGSFEYNFPIYKRCENYTNKFVCEQHEKFTLTFTNDSFLIYPTEYDRFGDERGFGDADPYIHYTDKTLTEFVSDIKFNDACPSTYHFSMCDPTTHKWLDTHCKCKTKYYKEYHTATLDVYPNSSTVVFKYYHDEEKSSGSLIYQDSENDTNRSKPKLIFKGVIYDDLRLSRTMDILNKIHKEKDVIVAIENILFTNKNIFDFKMMKKFNNKDVVHCINTLHFSSSELKVIEGYIYSFKEIKRNNVRYSYSYKAEYLIGLLRHLIKYYKNLIINQTLSSSIKNVYNNLQVSLKSLKISYDINTLKEVTDYLSKLGII